MKTPLFFLTALVAFFALPIDFTAAISVLFTAAFAAIFYADYRRTHRPLSTVLSKHNLRLAA